MIGLHYGTNAGEEMEWIKIVLIQKELYIKN